MNIYEKLTEVQNELKAPKSKYSIFGNYNYRSCEDIMEAVKPLLKDKKLAMTVKDDVFNIGDRFYIMATVTVFDCESEEKLSTTAFAREEAVKKGMDGSQITGSSSSYARKYALNGMFAIDDTKDADGWNTHEKDKPAEKKENKSEYASEEQIAKLRALYKGKEDKLTELLDKYSITNPVEFKRMEIQSIIDRLEAKVKQASKG